MAMSFRRCIQGWRRRSGRYGVCRTTFFIGTAKPYHFIAHCPPLTRVRSQVDSHIQVFTHVQLSAVRISAAAQLHRLWTAVVDVNRVAVGPRPLILHCARERHNHFAVALLTGCAAPGINTCAVYPEYSPPLHVQLMSL